METKDRRLKISQMLHNVLGSNNVYFDPPESVKMKYPAIVYTRAKINTISADNKKFVSYDRFEVTFIRKEADSTIVDAILELPYCEHVREYKASDLYHDVFTVYVI